MSAAVLLIAPLAHAATTAPQIQLQTDGDTIGVGEMLHLLMTVQSSDGPPSDPQLGIVHGFVLRGQNASPSQTHISINGNRTDRWGLTVDFALQAQHVGTFKLAPSVVVGDTRYSVSPVSIRVVPAGQAPRRSQPQPQPSPFGFSPFDPWKGLLQGVDPIAPELQAPAVNTDPRLALDAPRGASYFLHAAIDKTNAVVGEQVVLSVFEYIDAAQPEVEVDPTDVHDATVADFVKRPLLREDQDAQLLGYAAVGGRNWAVKLVRRWAIFPLHAGDLSIGPMSVSVVRPRSVAGKRTTEALSVHVVEPPAVGRPANYALGDVGKFSLTAQVTPRDLDQGGAVGVHVELSGTGNLPASIAVPATAGIEWLAPEVHEQVGSTGHDSYGGKRSFDYVVRVLRTGDVDLGELSLPFWEPDQRRYQVARAPLGTVHVKPSANGAAASAAELQDQRLAGLPAARDAFDGEPKAAHLDDSRLFWLLGVGGCPFALALSAFASSVSKKLLEGLERRRASPSSTLKERVAAANAASRGTDARATDAATERALQAAALAHAGISIRGAIGDEIVARLETAGIARAAACQVSDLLRECEAARFSPDATDVESARGRWTRARQAIASLEARS